MLEDINIDNQKHWFQIRNKKTDSFRKKPILLFLHGGPGMTTMYMNHFFEELEEHFILIDYDQRGAGKSFSFCLKKEDYTIDKYVEDIKVLVEYLKYTYEKEKVYICGHSWGSIIGILCASKYPELFYAYIGIGQIVNIKKSNKIAYRFILKKLEENGDKRGLKTLKKIEIPFFQKKTEFLKFRSYLNKYGGFRYDKKLNLIGFHLKELFFSKTYSFFDIVKLFLGIWHSLRNTWNELNQINLKRDIKELKVPVYLFFGKNDYISPVAIAKSFLKGLKAPLKEIAIIDEAAHDVHFEKNTQFISFCIKIKVQNETHKEEKERC